MSRTKKELLLIAGSVALFALIFGTYFLWRGGTVQQGAGGTESQNPLGVLLPQVSGDPGADPREDLSNVAGKEEASSTATSSASQSAAEKPARQFGAPVFYPPPLNTRPAATSSIQAGAASAPPSSAPSVATTTPTIPTSTPASGDGGGSAPPAIQWDSELPPPGSPEEVHVPEEENPPPGSFMYPPSLFARIFDIIRHR